MTDYFQEKSRQVEPSSVTAFGIAIVSRYGRARELRQMLSFAECLARNGLSEHVAQVFYDSNADLCSFEFKAPLRLGDPIEGLLRDIALRHVAQFEWFGAAYHGGSNTPS